MDNGETWGAVSTILPGLGGQAIGDGLAVDGMGRLHFVGQLRWPQGIYHATWSDGVWSEPELVYLIRESSTDDFGDRIHAHNVRLEIMRGNRLVMAFTPPPGGGVQPVLYVMTRTLDDLPEQIEPLEQSIAQAVSEVEGAEEAELSIAPEAGVEPDPQTVEGSMRATPAIAIGDVDLSARARPAQISEPIVLAAMVSLFVVAGLIAGGLVIQRR